MKINFSNFNLFHPINAYLNSKSDKVVFKVVVFSLKSSNTLCISAQFIRNIVLLFLQTM